jgi:hypothetical protein
MTLRLRLRTSDRSSSRDWCSRRRRIALVCALAVGPLLCLSTGAIGSAGASSAVTLTGRINGQTLSSSSESNPVRLYPLRATNIVVTVDNHTARPVQVGTVRLSGEVIGLTFFAFDNSVAFTVPPFHSATNRYSIPLVGLSGQATGLINGSLSVLNPAQQVVASQGLVVDVRGSLASVYGVFGLVVALLTVIALGAVLLELARRRLPANRFRRALYFVVPGLGFGLVLVFTLSATRVFVPSLSHWVPLVAGSTIIFFVIGFLTPDPGSDDEDDEDEDEDEEPLESGATPGAVVLPTPPTAPSQRQPAHAASAPEPASASIPGTFATPSTPFPAGETEAREREPAPATLARAPATATDTDGQSPTPEASEAGQFSDDPPV